MEILQGRWQHGEKLGYRYPSGLEKTLCKWDICPAGHERVKKAFALYNACVCRCFYAFEENAIKAPCKTFFY
jgi:hypothetical protein